MSDHDRYIPGVPCWIDTTQPDPDAAAAFYAAVFGWTYEDVTPADAPQRYAIAHRPGGTVGGIGGPSEAGVRPTWEMYVRVADADEAAVRVRNAGGRVLVEPTEVGPGGCFAAFADPAGAAFSVWQAHQRHGADVVNEHGAVNFNQLHTRDLEAATAFYGAVFGWELIGVEGAPMWALPGYGDFLEQRRPGMREQMAAMGAPERFEDVVASVIRTEDGDDAPDHWSVVFGVDDADAAAESAAAWGGTVVVPPFDAPWVRSTVLRDPQGALFTATKFVPENRDLPVAS